MTTATKSLLVTSIICFVVGLIFVSGLIDPRYAVYFYVALPTGAILFGLFLISLIFQKETARYDEEQRRAIAAAERFNAQSAKDDHCCCPTHAHPVAAKSS